MKFKAKDIFGTIFAIFKITLITLFLIKFGIFKGLLCIYFYYKLYDWLTLKLFNLERLRSEDIFFLRYKKREKYRIIVTMKIKDFEENRMKEFIYDKIIKKYRKFRCILISYFGIFHFFKEVSFKESHMRVNAIHVAELSDDNELPNYLQNQLNIPMKIKNNFLYEFHMVKFANTSEGALILKLDHTLSDGLGLVSLIGLIADNFNIQIIPGVMRKRNIPWKKMIYDFITLPYALFRHFTMESHTCPLNPSNLEPSGVTRLGISKAYDFQKIKLISKKLQVSINQLTLGIALSSLKQFIQLHYPYFPSNFIKMAMPIGNREITENSSNLKLENLAMMTFTNISLISNPIEDNHLISMQLIETVGNTLIPLILLYIMKFGVSMMPNFIYEFVGCKIKRGVDIVFSNVPGSNRAIYYSGSEVSDVISVINPGPTFAFTLMTTYNNNLRYVISLDEILKIDPQAILNIIDKTLLKVVDDFNNLSN